MTEEYPEISKTGKRYRLEVAENGDKLRHYESGVVYNESRSRLKAGAIIHKFTTANAAEMRKRRVPKPPANYVSPLDIVEQVERRAADRGMTVEEWLDADDDECPQEKSLNVSQT